jgi:threonine aldolase
MGGSAVVLDDAEITELQRGCHRFVHWHGKQTAAGLLATIPPDTELDRYGSGGVVAELERTVAELLGKPAAVFVPSGTMAQQAVLRVHADERCRPTVLFHPECHLDIHEGRGYQRLHGLAGRPVGQRSRLITLADLDEVAEPAAALVLELPQRDLGGVQPAWDDLLAQTAWTRERGAARHLDGARLWESAAGYGRPPAEIAALFDTVYVSFYKGLGALPGCCVAGEADVMAQLREWRGRMGGTLFGMWPNAASALTCLRERLPRMPEYLERAVAFAEAVADVDGVTVIPTRPQTPMFHLTFDIAPDRFDDTVRRLAIEQRIWTWGRAWPASTDSRQRVELSVGDGSRDFTPEEFREVVSAFVR